MHIQVATQSDSDQILSLIAELSEWLKTKGILQWTNYPMTEIENDISKGGVFVSKENGQIVATLTLTEQKQEFWGIPTKSAIYLSRVAVRRNKSGNKLGNDLVKWAEMKSQKLGFEILRLDCAASNSFLRNYYQNLGFNLLGIEHYKPYNMDFALFEKKLNL